MSMKFSGTIGRGDANDIRSSITWQGLRDSSRNEMFNTTGKHSQRYGNTSDLMSSVGSDFLKSTKLPDRVDMTSSGLNPTTTLSENFRKLKNIKFKFQDCNISIEKIVAACERRDRNHDGWLHIDDFEDVFVTIIAPYKNVITRRDMNFLIECCGYDRKYGRISYMDLLSLFENPDESQPTEKWLDEKQDDEFSNAEPGSIGEWLHKVACPVEIDNYKLLISHLENFERESGMRIKMRSGKMIVPLGPDLKAEINFITDG